MNSPTPTFNSQMKGKKIGDVAHQIASILLPMVQLYQQSDDLKGYLRRTIAWTVRELAEFFKVPMNVSVKAHEEAGGRDLRNMSWNQQRAHIDPKREIYHYEHTVEVGALTENILTAKTVDEIVANLMTYKICWILKVENSELNRIDAERRRLGGQKRRGENEWRATYEKANVVFQYPWPDS
ncbi:MAG: hypothetical protein Q8Q73_02120 [Stagnimonas sp.]|nr:hypothetical protein [Stagnimonas sp.]